MKWVGDERLAAGPEATWYLETAFTPGAHLGTVYDDPTTPIVVTGIEEVTAMRVPSGRGVFPWPGVSYGLVSEVFVPAGGRGLGAYGEHGPMGGDAVEGAPLT
ncbi:hypothetical protein [Streptomyces sp. Isolate_45]|uniref:hypothetical protein n=1 Tax=Streptomyces sp. Isolate_45 TaxID=2950111 RepID=UPI002481E0BE|nr:hypothetical protein [Streptomyces sp. Isolate_45]MDA5279259.1 hypothetical protein [Streptomyces sp. Isolate_45]